MITPAEVAERLDEVRARIVAAGGDPGAVTIVAVTKGFGPDAITAAVAAGCADIGENYAQEVVAKLAAIPGGLRSAGARLHFIGHLQANKINHLKPFVDCWQTVDRPSIAEALGKRVAGASVLIQVNVSGEPQKGGCAPEEAPALCDTARAAGLEVRGLMAVGRTGEPDQARPGFALLRRLVDDLGLEVCSMGMTGDLEVAVEEGSTMVRVGTALFGERPAR